MRRLIVMRHAKTERRADSGEDFDRALTDRGLSDAAATAHALAAAGLLADLALVSSAVRTQQTFEAMKAFLPDVRLERRRELYNADAATLWRAAEASDGDTVLLIAHNPGVHVLAQTLAARCVALDVDAHARLERGYPTATAAGFEIGDERIACLGVFGPDP